MPDSKRKPIIDSIREYVRTYPDIDNRKINIDYLGDGMEYSIDPIGVDPIYKRYVDGSCLKQFQFALISKEAYDGDARTGIANSGFYQNFEEWTEQNNLNDIVPELDGHDAIRVEVLQSGYLFSTEVDLGRYQMICRLFISKECEEMASEKMLVGRHKRVAFMDADGSGKTFTRMTGFTSLSDGKNSTEYSRQYVDEASERSDVVGYAPAIDYEFDRYTNDPVHEKIAAITDDEILGTEAQVDIVVVDLFEQKTSETTCTARKRTWSVIPDTEGDGTDALIYKGSFKAAGEITKGTATTTDGWGTCTFTAGGE